MKNSRIAFFLFLTLIAASSFIMSCKSSSTAPAATQAIPSVGSTFTVADSASGIVNMIVYTVFATTKTNPNPPSGSSVGKAIGLSGLHDTGGYDTLYLSYEGNGDVSIFPNPAQDPISWLTLPFVSHLSINTNFIEGAPNPANVNTSAAWNSGSSSFKLSSTSYSTDSVTVTITRVTPPSDTTIITKHYNYLPGLGLISLNRDDGDPPFVDGTLETLISYTPK